MLFLSIFSILCLFITSTLGLSVGRDDGQFRSFSHATDIRGEEEITTHLSYKRAAPAQHCDNKINPDLQKCHDMSKRAAIAAKSPDNALFNKIFGDLDQKWRDSVSEIFTLIAGKCDPSGPSGSKVFCLESIASNTCSYKVGPTAFMRNRNVYVCPKFWNKKYDAATCGEDGDRATVLVHEFAHTFQINGKRITDFAYADQSNFYDLTSNEALINAGSYEFFARMQYHNCDYEKRLAELGWEDKSLPSEGIAKTSTSKVPNAERASNSGKVLSDNA